MLTVELSSGELLVTTGVLVLSCDQLVSQVFNVATSSRLYVAEVEQTSLVYVEMRDASS